MGGMQNNLNFRRREVNPVLTFSELVELFKTARKREEGQTMAEYAVVLAVITVATVAVFTARFASRGSIHLSGGSAREARAAMHTSCRAGGSESHPAGESQEP